MRSKIFESFFAYFRMFLPKDITLDVTHRPMANMDIYHYHRPHLEKSFKPNSVVTLHHDLYDIQNGIEPELFGKKLSTVKKIICLNQTQISILRQMGVYQTLLIPHGIRKTFFHQHKRILPEDKLRIGIVSKRYNRRVKGEAYLRELGKRLEPKNVSFCLIGEGREVEYHFLTQMGFDVVFYDTLPYTQFDELYRYIDILLITSLYEGGPASIPEALYTRTPIVARPVGMVPDVLIEGDNGFYLTGSLSSDVKLIHALARNENNLMGELIGRLNQAKPQIYSWEEVILAYANCYQSLYEN